MPRHRRSIISAPDELSIVGWDLSPPTALLRIRAESPQLPGIVAVMALYRRPDHAQRVRTLPILASETRAMWKIVATGASMAVGGAVTFFVTILVLMELGTKFHDNYEYYGRYPVLFLGPAVLGFLAPGVVVWYLDRRGVQSGWKVAGTLALMVVSGVVTYAVAFQIVGELERRLQGDDNDYSMYPALAWGFYGLAVVGFLAPGVIVWYLHRKAGPALTKFLLR